MATIPTDWSRNGMSEAEWDALPEAARVWRREHPRVDRAGAKARPMVGNGTLGKPAERAAPSGAVTAPTPGLAPPGQGAQVVLTGDAQAAARGALHGTIAENTEARDRAIAAGHVAPGATAAAADDAVAGEPPVFKDDPRAIDPAV